MSHVGINSILPANVYNGLIIDHEATERAELLELKRKHLPALFKILAAHGVDDFVELHLLHRHFTLQNGEALVHKTPEIPGSEDDASICVDIAKAVTCPESVKDSLVPLLWMATSNGSLIAYEYGLRGCAKSPQRTVANISPETWDILAQDFSAYVHSAGIADIVSLKDKSCINGGEYVVPGMRVLFRVPTEAVNIQPGSGVLESGWNSTASWNQMETYQSVPMGTSRRPGKPPEELLPIIMLQRKTGWILSTRTKFRFSTLTPCGLPQSRRDSGLSVGRCVLQLELATKCCLICQTMMLYLRRRRKLVHWITLHPSSNHHAQYMLGALAIREVEHFCWKSNSHGSCR